MKIRKCIYQSFGEWVAMLIIHLAGLVDFVVFIATLGFYSIELRGYVLFSGILDNLSENQ